MSVPEPDLEELEQAIDDLRLLRHQADLEGREEDAYGYTWEISGLLVEHGRMLAEIERAEILLHAHQEKNLERVWRAET